MPSSARRCLGPRADEGIRAPFAKFMVWPWSGRRRNAPRHDGVYDSGGQFGGFSEGFLGGLLALANQLALELKPGAFFVHHAAFDTDVQDAAFFVDAVIVNDVEFGFAEGRSDF